MTPTSSCSVRRYQYNRARALTAPCWRRSRPLGFTRFAAVTPEAQVKAPPSALAFGAVPVKHNVIRADIDSQEFRHFAGDEHEQYVASSSVPLTAIAPSNSSSV